MNALPTPWRWLSLLLGLLLAGGAASATQLLADGSSAVREIVLQAPQLRVSAEAVRELVARQTRDSRPEALAEVDLAALREALLGLPWVKAVSLRREWPDRLHVQLVEHRPVATLADGRVLTADGSVLALGAVPGVPKLDVGEADAERAWHTWQGMAASFDDGPLAPEVLQRDGLGQWAMKTRSGVWLRLGAEDPLERVEWLQRAVLPALEGRMERVDYIDLRYGNGFAVGWRDDGPTGD